MNSVLEILDAVAATTKISEKQTILGKASTGPLGTILHKVFLTAYDKKTNFFIRSIDMTSFSDAGSVTLTLDQAINDCISMLSTRRVTGNAARDAFLEIVAKLSFEDAIVLHRTVILRDLRCGAGMELARRVWGDDSFDQETPVMLCQPDKPKNRARIKFPAFSQLKSDGMRLLIYVQMDPFMIQYISRNGKKVSCNSPDLDAEFASMMSLADEPMVFDGELLWTNEDGTVAPREIGNGKAQKATKGEMSEADRKRFHVALWDVIPARVVYQDGDAIKSDPYRKRIQDLNMMWGASEHKKIGLVETRQVESWEEASSMFEEMRDSGQEGVIVKNIDHIWIADRSKDCVKLKAELDAEFRVIGWNEGSGKYEGMIGSLIVASEDGMIEFSVAGIPDDIRAMAPELLMDEIVTVIFNGIMPPNKKTGKMAAFLPRIKEIRNDKERADSSTSILSKK